MVNFENTQIAFEYKTNQQLKKAYWLFKLISNPTLTKIGTWCTLTAIKLKLPIYALLKGTLFEQFCGGRNLNEAFETSLLLEKYDVGTILDYGVEGKEGEDNFDFTVGEFIKAIDFASGKNSIPFISIKVTGFARFSLLEKLNKNESLNENENEEWQRVCNRIDKIISYAKNKNIFVLIDAEESWIQDPIDRLADDMMKKHNDTQAFVYNTFQMYRHDRLQFLKDSLNRAKQENYILGTKLVRGAYMEKERTRATENNYPSPIQPDKQSTDRDYNEAILFVAKNIQHCFLFIGTHNEYSNLKGVELIDAFHIPKEKVYFSQLYGMSDNISFNLSKAHFKVVKYLPYGPVKEIVPYMMRRAQENTSIEGQTSRELCLIKKEMNRRKLQ